MISSQRQHLILSRLRTRGAVRITALSKELGVSAMTIRRDIADLADKGLLKRVHGGAVSTSTLLSEPLFSVKSQMDIGLKDAIAQEAVKYVAPGDVIAIGGGTTAYVFAQHLLESQQSSGITILTNSIPVAELVQALESKDVEGIVTGGHHALQLARRADRRQSGRLAARQHRIPGHAFRVHSARFPHAELAGSRNRYGDDGHCRSHDNFDRPHQVELHVTVAVRTF